MRPITRRPSRYRSIIRPLAVRGGVLGIAMAVAQPALGQTPRAPDQSPEQTPQLIQELFQGEVVYPQGRGETQLTLAPRLTHDDEARTTTLEFGAEYGVTDAWQLQVGGDGFVRRVPATGPAAQGMGDLSLGTKYSWMHLADGGTYVALGGDVDLPTGNSARQLGDGAVAVTPYLVLARDMPRLWSGQLSTELAVTARARHSADEHNELFWNVGAVTPLGGSARLTNELTVQRQIGRGTSGAEAEVSFTPGVIWHLGEVETGAGVPVRLDHGVAGRGVFLHLIYEFGGDDDR